MGVYSVSKVFAGFLFVWTMFGHAYAQGYVAPEAFENESSELKMLVFLSEKCPCSKSHIKHVKDLMSQYKDLKVYGVISEPAQNPEEKTKKDNYFMKEDFGFAVINDPQQFLVKKYQALKTPHVVVLSKKDSDQYHIIYQGGLTDSKTYTSKSKKYLEEALAQVARSENVKVKNGFCLGCHIRRF